MQNKADTWFKNSLETILLALETNGIILSCWQIFSPYFQKQEDINVGCETKWLDRMVVFAM